MVENNVAEWAEAIASLPDKEFFRIMRLYLGEIKTPYNKQRLTQQLAAFIKQAQNLENLLKLLDSFDIQVLTAISLISNASQENITDFFKNKYSLGEIYSQIMNLKERLLIYSRKDPYSGREILFLNPLISQEINNYLDVKELFPIENIKEVSTEDSFIISPNFIAAFISYIKIHKISCKADGKLKKNDINKLEELFPGRIECLQLLLTAFINLSILIDDNSSLKFDDNKLLNFAKLPLAQQFAFLCAASVSRFSRDGLKKEAQLLLDCLNSIPQTGYTSQTLLWLAFLAGSYSQDGNAQIRQSRFSQLLQSARAQESNTDADLLDRMIDSAVTFGLLQKIGINNEDKEIYICGQINQFAQEMPQAKVLNIDSTFTVTLMPGLSLLNQLAFTDFMNLKKFGIVTEYEISKKSVSYAFDRGLTPEDIFATVNKFSYYEIPQNLKINIQEWYKAYSSAVIYSGYILKVSDNNIQIAENNPNIKKYLKEKLAEGIYLLNLPPQSNINIFKQESGLEFLGNIKTYSESESSLPFPKLSENSHLKLLNEASEKDYKKIDINQAQDLLKELKTELSTMELDQHKKESLEYRIKNRMILSTEQLKIASIRSEILEAEGMDFNGKIHLIETAIKEEDLLEIQLADAKGNYVSLVGHALSLTKQIADGLMRFQIEPSGFIDSIIVSQISHVKRLRY
ncbi:MAG: helicase-associated domain-containing protein [Treponema sp.]|nr:helicase-associated domain-containing protein [Treponema sp.]